MLDRFIKESKEYKEFQDDVKKGHISHAYLLVGADKYVQEQYIKILAMTIICQNHGCGVCKDCTLTKTDKHLAVFNNIDLTGAGAVKRTVDLLDSIARASYDYDNRVYIIKDGEKLSAQVQNKLLKTYEEPPEGAIIFLLTANEANILPTIKSRAKTIFLPNFSVDKIYKQLLSEGVDQSIAEVSSTLSGGRLDFARNFSKSENLNEHYIQVLEMLKNLNNSRQIVEYINNALFNSSKQDDGMTPLEITFDFIEIIFRDVLVYASGNKTQLMTIGKEDYLEKLAKKYSIVAASIVVEKIAKVKEYLKFNVASISAVEKFLFEMLESAYLYADK